MSFKVKPVDIIIYFLFFNFISPPISITSYTYKFNLIFTHTYDTECITIIFTHTSGSKLNFIRSNTYFI